VDNKLRGIGGWLILVLIGLISALVKTSFDIEDLIETFQPVIRITITTYITVAHHPTFGVWVLYEVIFNALVIVFIICLLVFSKSRFFPKLSIFYLIVVTFLHGIDYILGYEILPGLTESTSSYPSTDGILQALATAVLWIPYFLVSKRVKTTFLNREPNIVLEREPIGNDI
jgi:hypothetical protein